MPFKSVVGQSHIVTPDLDTLQGLNCPNPSQNQGSIVFVPVAGDAGSGFFGLVLDEDLPPDGVNILPSILGGTSKWVRLNIGKAVTPVNTATFYAYGSINASGESKSGERFSSSQLSTGTYSIVFEAEGLPVDPERFDIQVSAREDQGNIFTAGVVAKVLDQSVTSDGFTILVRNLTDAMTPGALIDCAFDFSVVVGTLIPIP